MTECLFCKLIEQQANKIFENDKVYAMLSPEPAAPGHIIILPKQHAPILEAVPDFVVSDMFKIANKIGVAVFEGLSAHGTNLLVQNGTAAGQKHNHVMLHVIPRFDKDGVQLTWEPKEADQEELARIESMVKEEGGGGSSVFEQEAEKPVTLEKPKEVTEKDLRTKQLDRLP